MKNVENGCKFDCMFRQNIAPVVLPEKEELLKYLFEINTSFTERVDVMRIANVFILESVQLIANGIFLFEMGYFDAAFYSVRQSIETSTTMLYLLDKQDKEKNEKDFSSWKNEEFFPMTKAMLKSLHDYGVVFKEVSSQIPDFFENIKDILDKNNKCVHKQGFKYLYTIRKGFFFNKKQDDMIQEFLLFVKQAIRIVAIMRLVIDPLPILVKDEEIFHRMFETLNRGFSDDFITNIIGEEIIEKYKNTEFYKAHYESFISKEKQKPEVTDFIQHQYIDTQKILSILSQIHLVSPMDVPVLLFCATNNKVCKAYSCGGMRMFFTDKNTNRLSNSISSLDFDAFSKSETPYNQKYDEAYISVFTINEHQYFFEHNETLSDDEIGELLELASKF